MLDLPRAGLPKRWQKFGDLILIPSGLTLTESDLNQICVKYKVTRIAQQSSIRSNEIRTPGANLLIGKNTKIIQKENGISYQYDLTKNMFSRGNISEKIRISKISVTDQLTGL